MIKLTESQCGQRAAEAENVAAEHRAIGHDGMAAKFEAVAETWRRAGLATAARRMATRNQPQETADEHR